MFNGIIYNQGVINKIQKKKNGMTISLSSNIKISSKDVGMSICCDGVCLTLTSHSNKISQFYLSNETLKKSKFSKIKIYDKVNLELPLKFGQRISGHICQGHVDCIAILKSKKKIDKSYVLTFKIKKKMLKDLIEKASILINGVSLTISKILNDGFQIWVIPHTLKLTNLSQLKKNDPVNVEIDILSKYVKKNINAKS